MFTLCWESLSNRCLFSLRTHMYVARLLTIGKMACGCGMRQTQFAVKIMPYLIVFWTPSKSVMGINTRLTGTKVSSLLPIIMNPI